MENPVEYKEVSMDAHKLDVNLIKKFNSLTTLQDFETKRLELDEDSTIEENAIELCNAILKYCELKIDSLQQYKCIYFNIPFTFKCPYNIEKIGSKINELLALEKPDFEIRFGRPAIMALPQKSTIRIAGWLTLKTYPSTDDKNTSIR